MAETKKYQITVKVTPHYLPEQSDEESGRFVFAYHVEISNTGNMPAKLLTRHWVITEAGGEVQEVRGQGVIGEQPHLSPGQGFEYVSGTAIASPVGTMRGSYHFLADDGEHFEVEIGEFVLAVPRVLH